MTSILFWKRTRGLKVVLFILAFNSIVSHPLRAQSTEPTEGLPEEVPTSPAVEDISGHPFWLADLLERGSPLHIGFTAGETYDDNIFISPDKTGDFLTHISPSFDFEKGDRTAPNANYLNVYFAPTIFLYENHSNQDRTDFDADVFYQYQWTRLTLGLEQHYQHLTDASIDIGNLADRDVYTTIASGNYVYNGKLGFFGTATMRITSYQNGSDVDTNEWIVDAYALYQFAPKLSLGIGPRIGFVDIIGAPNEDYQDLLFHLTYNPEGKINATLSGGVEHLQYQGNTPDHLLPIFDLTANYSPRDGTSISLSASRQSLSSYDIAGENYLDTSVQVGFSQRFLEDFYFKLSAGYTIADYEFGSLQLSGLKRNDDYYFANIGVEWDPKDWLKVNASYQRSEDHSTFAQNSFNDNQIDIEASLHF